MLAVPSLGDAYQHVLEGLGIPRLRRYRRRISSVSDGLLALIWYMRWRKQEDQVLLGKILYEKRRGADISREVIAHYCLIDQVRDGYLRKATHGGNSNILSGYEEMRGCDSKSIFQVSYGVSGGTLYGLSRVYNMGNRVKTGRDEVV